MQTSADDSEQPRRPSQCATSQEAPPPASPRRETVDEEAMNGTASMHTQAKKPGRGMSGRRRIGLKIEADDEGGLSRRDGAADDGKESQVREGDVAAAGGEACEEWWKHEYKAPPPGHLGAHAIPVAAARGDALNSPGSGGPKTRRNSIESTERKLERMGVAATAAASETSELQLHHTQQQHRPNVHETPERANRRVRGGSELYDATTSHSSPNQKRKIIDLQDFEAGTFPSMSVAKELKRFHETNAEQQLTVQHESDSETAAALRTAVVTPSNLLHPMKKIDIQAGSSSSSSSSSSSTHYGFAKLSGDNGKASKSA